MITCINCSFENPADAKFCQNCGQALATICPNCATANAPGVNFCKNCGQPLGAAGRSVPAPQATTSPEEEGERRIVTVLFCDVVGSTALGERLDPEEWTEIMNGAFERLIAPVTRYDGTVARLMGDAILTLFGAPKAHEDDPYRAVLAALDMLNELRPYQDQIRRKLIRAGVQPDPTDFEVRVGINTGLVVAGRVGSENLGEYTVMGDAVNVAARMEQTATPGTIQIGYDTYRLVAPFVEVESLGAIEVRGKRDPVLAYRVLGLKAKPGRLRGLEGMASPLIGRVREMTLLGQAVDRLLVGGGQTICLIAEAGLGKSRLIEELHASLADGRELVTIHWYQAESLSFETMQPYGLVQRLLRRIFDVSQDDAPGTIREQTSRKLTQLTPEQETQISRTLGLLLAIEDESSELSLTGEDLKREIFAGMLALTRALAESAPTILVFDDLHWADATSTELVSQLLPLTVGAPLLIICAFRPDRTSQAWRIKQLAERDFPHAYLEVALQPLTGQESNALVGGLLSIADLPEQVGALILERSEGIPFFVEEIVRDLIEVGSLVPAGNNSGWRLASSPEAIHIPGSLEALLVARMDRLGAGARRTLQLAAVIGRSFYHRVLKMIAGNGAILDEQLRTLQRAGMILEANRKPELEYRFQHALTQEAAYNTILLRQRRHYHQRVAEIIEELFVDRLEEYAPLLAHHFAEAGNDVRALHYSTLAAERAARLFANDEAVIHFGQAIEAAGRVSLDAPSLAALHRGRALVYETLGDFDLARADHEAALEIARAAGESRAEWRALLDLGKLWASRDYDRTGDYFERALQIARSLDDRLILARSLNRIGNWYTNAEEPLKAIEYHHEALAIFEELGEQRGQADSMDLLGMANMLAGDSIRAVPWLEKAINLYRELGDLRGLASSLTSHGALEPVYEYLPSISPFPLQGDSSYANEALKITREMGWRSGESFALWAVGLRYIVVGEFGRALEITQAGLRIATEIGHRQWMTSHQSNMALIYCNLLAAEEALPHAKEALSLARAIQSRYWIHVTSGTLAKVHILLGDFAQSRACLQAVLDSETPMNSLTRRYCWARWAELDLAEGKADAALDTLEKLIDSIPGMGPGKVISSLWRLRGEALIAVGRTAEAESLLLAALKYAQAIGEQGQLWRIQAILGRLYLLLNRTVEAEDQLANARQEIDYLAETISDEALAKKFHQRAYKMLVAG